MAKKTASPVVQSPTARATPSVKTATVTPATKTTATAAPVSRDQLMAQVVASTMGPPAPSPQQIAANVAATEARLAAAPATTAAVTQQPSGISLTGAAPSTTPTTPPKIATTVDPSTGFPILDRNAIDTTMDKYLKNPSYVRSFGENMMGSNAYRDNFDKFGWNVKSDASSILRGRAIFGLNQGYTNAQLMQAAKTLGIPIDNYYKTENQRGRTVTSIDSQRLLSEIDKKTDGMYVVTNSVDGTNKHATVFYRDDGTGRLIPQKDVDGKPSATFFTAERNEKSNWYDLPLEAIRVGGPMIVSALVTGNPNFTMTQQLALNAGAQLIAGADPETVLRSVIGSISASQVPAFLKDVQVVANADPVLKSALTNAAVQATYSTFLPNENIALNAIAGAIGGTAAELAGDLGDPALEKSIGEYFKNRTLGMSDLQAGFAAAQDYAQSLVAIDSKNRTAAQNQVVEAFSQPRTAGVGTQIGEATASLDRTLATTPGFETTALPPGSEEAGVMTPINVEEGGIRFPGADVPAADIEAAMRIPSGAPSGATGAAQILTPKLPTIPSGSSGASTTPKIPQISLPTGAGGGAAGGVPSDVFSPRDRDILDLTGIAPTAPSEEPLRVDVEGGQKPEEPTLPPVEVIGERETELTPKPQTEEEIPEEDQLLALTPKPKDTIILDLISGGGAQRGQRIPTTPEAESMAALTQALRIGDPGDALFGGKLGRRRNVWNVESLRLRDELGG